MNVVIKILLTSLCVITLTSSATADLIYPHKRPKTTFPVGDGQLVIYNYHLDELLETKYREGETYNKDALKKIQHIFRSRSDNKQHKIDIVLIELVDHLQDHFGADAIELISGYRSPELNRELKKSGISVAQESLHMKGIAADIHIDEITESKLAEYARSLKVGGVGYYPAQDFVHVDTGRLSSWNKPDTPGRALIAFQKGDVWQILTDKNTYFPGEKVSYEIENIANLPKTFNTAPVMQLFRRGKWQTVRKIQSPRGKIIGQGNKWRGVFAPLHKDGYGKYRIIIPQKSPHPEVRSNEFYIKRM